MQNQPYYFSYKSTLPPYQQVQQQFPNYFNINPTAPQFQPRIYYQEIPTINPNSFQYYQTPFLYETAIQPISDQPDGYFIPQPQQSYNNIYPDMSVAPPTANLATNFQETFYYCDINSSQPQYVYPLNNYSDTIILPAIVRPKNCNNPNSIDSIRDNNKLKHIDELGAADTVDDEFSTLFTASDFFAKGFNKIETKDSNKKIKIKKPKNNQNKEKCEPKQATDLMRKKHKRFMIVNQKADAELAEISAEQDALKNRSSNLIKSILMSSESHKHSTADGDSLQNDEINNIYDASLPHNDVNNLPLKPDVISKQSDSTDSGINSKSVISAAIEISDIEKEKESLSESKNDFSKLGSKELQFIEDATAEVTNEKITSDNSTAISVPCLPINNSLEYTLSPLSQLSPYYLSPASNDFEILGQNPDDATRSSIATKIHSRRFREYCNQVLNKSIDDCCTQLLQDLVKLQDKLYNVDSKKKKVPTATLR